MHRIERAALAKNVSSNAQSDHDDSKREAKGLTTPSSGNFHLQRPSLRAEIHQFLVAGRALHHVTVSRVARRNVRLRHSAKRNAPWAADPIGIRMVPAYGFPDFAL